MTAPMQESPVRVNPATPSDHPENAHEQQYVMAEIDLDNGQVGTEQGGTAATDLKLASEQTAMQGLHGYQATAHAAAATARKGVALPPLQLYSDLPREWPMARLCISSKQVNRFVRTILWRRVAERALRGTYFGNIPAEVYPAYTADLLHISQAFAAPLAELFAFVKQGHQPCSFIPQKQLTLHANPLFWQYGLLAFVSGCCAFNNEHRHKHARAAKAAPSKQEEPRMVSESTAAFLAAMEPQPLWVGSLPVCLVEYHQGQSRRLRLALTSQDLLTKGEKSLLDKQHPVHSSGLLFGYAADRCTEPDQIG